MEPVIFHLIGTPGVGKYTVGTELAQISGAKLVDNHAIANVIFNVLDQDGIKPLPAGVWAYVRQVRQAVLDTMMHLSPPHLSFIFTNYIRGEDENEYAYFLENVAVAEVRGCRFIPVLLTCETSELMNRIGSESRRERMKLLDPVEARRLNDEVPRFTTDHPNFFQIDTTHRSPAESARLIVETAEKRTEKGATDTVRYVGQRPTANRLLPSAAPASVRTPRAGPATARSDPARARALSRRAMPGQPLGHPAICRFAATAAVPAL